MWNSIASQISHATQKKFEITVCRSVNGGSINQTYFISDGEQSYFVKVNEAREALMFELEALALQQMAATQTIHVPLPICQGIAAESAYLVLEWLELGCGNAQAWEVMGHNLAALHRVTSDRGFGWQRHNTIGSTPQKNPWTESWIEFFTQHRLGYQFQLAQRRGGHFPFHDQLLSAVPDILAGHDPAPSLVHGDLWLGNAAVTPEGPVIFDPAAYFGDREVDLAMTELFGTFPDRFYSAYKQAFPLRPGYSQRKILYNLYHILNHFNLFGGSYESQANRMIMELL